MAAIFSGYSNHDSNNVTPPAEPPLHHTPRHSNVDLHHPISTTMGAVLSTSTVAMRCSLVLSQQQGATPRSESDGFIITHLAKPAFYQCVTLDDEIHPESIDGTWYPARYEATDPELVAPRAA
ncbi:hypothetical protein BDV29DRAFT_161139 [Aspergillus leporis]|uniref:Uncharacterized protein n=1 Tax=Aspergillus leporis TaxID=41062 RepID=A0A5N5WRM7_9EURO|nr:hypothetical protein BDV29DRAFT_161139 [Aspergillus leporis]